MIRALLIEDNPADARLIQEMLAETNSLHFEFSYAFNLMQGIEMVEDDFHIILLDLSLPDSFGLVTFSRVHERASHIPIVVLSGNKDEEVALAAVKMGAQDYVMKGRADGELLSRVMTYAIERKRTEIMLREMSSYVERVREEERTRIAREIHDELGGVLAAIKFDLSIPEQQKDKKTRGVMLRNAKSIHLVDSAIRSLRRIMADLRPSILDDLGLWAALEWQAHEFQDRTGIICTFELRGDERDLPTDHSTSVFRIVQEALTNIAKHAGATHVWITAVISDQVAIIRIRDNGRGIRREDLLNMQSFGILGMHERARTFKGTVKISSATPTGTEVVIDCPLKLHAHSKISDAG